MVRYAQPQETAWHGNIKNGGGEVTLLQEHEIGGTEVRSDDKSIDVNGETSQGCERRKWGTTRDGWKQSIWTQIAKQPIRRRYFERNLLRCDIVCPQEADRVQFLARLKEAELRYAASGRALLISNGSGAWKGRSRRQFAEGNGVISVRTMIMPAGLHFQVSLIPVAGKRPAIRRACRDMAGCAPWVEKRITSTLRSWSLLSCDRGAWGLERDKPSWKPRETAGAKHDITGCLLWGRRKICVRQRSK